MSGDFLPAEEAHRIGLYNRIVPQEDVVAEAVAFAQKLAKGPSFALAVTKDSLNKEADMDLPAALDAEAQAQAVCMLSPNFREAYHAFVDKREPKFV